MLAARSPPGSPRIHVRWLGPPRRSRRSTPPRRSRLDGAGRTQLLHLLPPGEGAPNGPMRGLRLRIGPPPEEAAHDGAGSPHPAVPATFSRGEKVKSAPRSRNGGRQCVSKSREGPAHEESSGGLPPTYC